MIRPPRIAEWLFNKYCGAAKVDDLRGDMEEIFLRNVSKVGKSRAKIIYWRQVLSLLFSYAIRKRKQNARHHHFSSTNPFDMWANYFKVGFRNLSRNRYFTILNMVGLAIGMSISLLIITLFVSVTDYDEFHTNKKNIYRVITKTHEGKDLASAPAILGDRLKEEFPGIREVIHMGRGLYSGEPLPKQNVSFFGLYADPAFLTTFTFPLVAGDAKTALNDPRSVVLTEHTAKKIFGENDPMGKQIMLDSGPAQVTGVMKDFPQNTHFSFHAIAPFKAVENQDVDKAWSAFSNNYVYLHLKDDADLAALQAYLDKTASQAYATNPDFKATFSLQALGEITPGLELDNQIGPQWSYISFVYAGGIALLILLPACFNYTNISIARALKRSKEIGLRKTLGGMRTHIFSQFIAETVGSSRVDLQACKLEYSIVSPK